MWVSIENCEGGFIVEGHVDHRDAPFQILHSAQDWKIIKPTYDEVEKHLREVFCKNALPIKVPVVTDLGKK